MNEREHTLSKDCWCNPTIVLSDGFECVSKENFENLRAENARLKETLKEIEHLQAKLSAYENDFVLLNVVEKFEKAQARVQEAEKRIAELEETILQDTKVNIAHIALLNSDIAELEKEQQWIHQDKTLIVKKDGDSWYAVCPDFKDLQQSESRWFSGDIGKYMDAVYLYLNDEHHPPQESEK